MYDTIAKPRLIEPGIKYYINEALKQSHIIQDKYNTIMFNICMLLIFIAILGGILFYKYKGKLSPHDKYIKKREQYQYVLSQIKKYQNIQNYASDNLFTQLPLWN
jgi:hypothetical protein